MAEKSQIQTQSSHLFQYLICLGDDHLILGHRLSQWCGHAPMLEEDLALANIALDLLGQARNLLSYAGEVEARGRDEDALAYLRKEHEYRNLMLVERPNGDFAQTILRQLFFSTFAEILWETLSVGSDKKLAAIAQKARKESRYHVRHSAEWVIRLGDGTAQSAERMRAAIEMLAPNIFEMFDNSSFQQALNSNNPIVDHSKIKSAWMKRINAVFAEAGLDPDSLNVPPVGGSRQGQHSEAMGHLLSELQYMQRTYPGCQW